MSFWGEVEGLVAPFGGWGSLGWGLRFCLFIGLGYSQANEPVYFFIYFICLCLFFLNFIGILTLFLFDRGDQFFLCSALLGEAVLLFLVFLYDFALVGVLGGKGVRELLEQRIFLLYLLGLLLAVLAILLEILQPLVALDKALGGQQ